jgi:hypothetical protein
MPKAKKKYFLTVVVDRALYEAAKRQARSEDRSVAAMIRRVLSEITSSTESQPS